MSLGFIGSSEAEAALCSLFGTEVDEGLTVEGLIACGSPSAMSTAIAHAKTKPNGPAWICERIGHVSLTRGWSRGEFYTHVHTAELVDFLDAEFRPGTHEENWQATRAFEQLDSAEVRRLLRKWSERRGTTADPLVRESDRLQMSDLCYEALVDRGDEAAIRYVLDRRADDEDDVYVFIAADDLRYFPSPAVAAEIVRRLAAATEPSPMVRLLALLGRFGDASDAGPVRRLLDHPDNLVANVACETLLRLTDPLLVPDHWREM